jgi:hypothetical protein
MSKPFNFQAFIMRILRRGSYKWPARNAVLKRARVDRGVYMCDKCAKLTDRHDIAIDHIQPVIDPLTGFTTWDSYIERLYCPESNLQCLCLSCHKEKSNGENEVRRRTKAEVNADRRKYRAKKNKKDPNRNQMDVSVEEFLKECGISLTKK